MTQSKKTFNLFAVSEARNVLFGIATLWIGLFHMDQLYQVLSLYIDNETVKEVLIFIPDMGNIGVDIFLFLSGIGLYFSFSKDSRYGVFLKKRMMRVLPTAFLIGVFYFSFNYVTGRFTSGPLQYLSRITFTYFFWTGERVFWFISLILVLYLLFPLIYRAIDRWRVGGMLALVAVTVALTFVLRAIFPDYYAMIEIALCRIPVFLVGVWAGRFVKEKREISVRWLWLALAVFIAMTVLIHFTTDIARALDPGYTADRESMYLFIYRYASCPLSIAFVLLFSRFCVKLRHAGKANLLRNFFEFVGMYSMEYYMIFLNINHHVESALQLEARYELMLYCGSFFLSLVLCVLTRKVCDFFMTYMQLKPKS